MLVRNWMSKNVITINIDDSLESANKLMNENHIQCLPVLNRKKLVGIFTESDLKKASASGANSLEVHELEYLLKKVKIDQVMTPNPVEVQPDNTVDEVAQIMEKFKISKVPVMNAGELVGIITQSDIFKALMTLSGVSNINSVQFAVQVPNIPGVVRSIIDILNPFKSRIASILTSYTSDKKVTLRIYIRVYDFDKKLLIGIREQLREKSQLLYIVGNEHQISEIYH
jgi:acetoin utilization protein AcuB